MKISFRKVLFIGLFSLLMLGAIFSYQFAKFYDGKLHVVFCNVGQGDGIFIRSPQGLDVVIDGGPDSSILSCLSKHMPFWDRTIELVILTHPHEDHLNGLIDVLQRYTVLSFYTEKIAVETLVYKNLMQTLAEKKLTSHFLSSGDRLLLDNNIVLRTIWPSQSQLNLAKTGKSADFDVNDLCVIELLTFGKFSVLFTGDGNLFGQDGQDKIDQEIDVLKVPHHGSSKNIDQDFLEKAKPQLAVISVGKNNRYGHPSPKTLKMLQELGIQILRTDLDGEVEVVSDGKGWRVTGRVKETVVPRPGSDSRETKPP